VGLISDLLVVGTFPGLRPKLLNDLNEAERLNVWNDWNGLRFVPRYLQRARAPLFSTLPVPRPVLMILIQLFRRQPYI
jgi:hypothetical protein